MIDWKLILEYVGALNDWPLMVLIVVLILRRPLTDAIDRLRRASKEGLDFGGRTRQRSTADEPPPSSDEYKELMNWGDSNLLPESERGIDEDLERKNVRTDAEKVNVLRRHLAVTQIYLEFEKIHANIFGSQIALLRDLNSVVEHGRDAEYIRSWAESAIERNGLTNWNTEMYMLYLKNGNLVLWDEKL